MPPPPGFHLGPTVLHTWTGLWRQRRFGGKDSRKSLRPLGCQRQRGALYSQAGCCRRIQFLGTALHRRRLCWGMHCWLMQVGTSENPRWCRASAHARLSGFICPTLHSSEVRARDRGRLSTCRVFTLSAVCGVVQARPLCLA